MSNPNKIKIDTVTGGRPQDRDDLKHCCFLPSADNPGYYNLFDQRGLPVATTPALLSTDTDWSFTTADDIVWTFSDFSIDDSNASGDWSNTDSDPAAEEGGTFTAQAGGGIDTDAAASANA